MWKHFSLFREAVMCHKLMREQSLLGVQNNNRKATGRHSNVRWMREGQRERAKTKWLCCCEKLFPLRTYPHLSLFLSHSLSAATPAASALFHLSVSGCWWHIRIRHPSPHIRGRSDIWKTGKALTHIAIYESQKLGLKSPTGAQALRRLSAHCLWCHDIERCDSPAIAALWTAHANIIKVLLQSRPPPVRPAKV
jgi:hypothetical protein